MQNFNLSKICRLSVLSLIFCLPFSKAAVEVFAVISIVAFIAMLFTNERKDVVPRIVSFAKSPIMYALCGLILAHVLSIFISIDVSLSLESFFSKFLEPVAVFIVAFLLFRTEKTQNVFMYVLVASFVLISFDSIFQLIFGFDFLRFNPSQNAGTLIAACFHNPNVLAGWIVLVLFPVVAFIFNLKKPVHKWLLSIPVLMSFFSFLYTDARAAWVTVLFVFVLCFIIYSVTQKKRFSYRYFFAIIMLMVVVYLFLPHHIKERIISIIYLKHYEIRLSLWKQTWATIKHYHFLGSGINTYTQAVVPFVREQGTSYPHNSYLHLVSDVGAAGLIAFLFYIFLLFKKLFYRIITNFNWILFGISASLLSFVIYISVDTHLFSLQMSMLFWVLSGISLAKSEML